MAISLPPDGIGKSVETNTPDGTNHRQVVTVGDKSTAANTLAVDGSGRVTANINGTVSVRPTDGTNAITKTFDVDSGAGTEYVEGVSLRKSASGGSVEAGTSTDPLRIDPTGTTIQPVSWSGQSVTVTQGTGSNLHTVIDSGTVSTITNVVHVDDNSGSLTVDSAQLPAALDGSGYLKVHEQGTANVSVQNASLAVTGTFWQTTQPVSGTVTVQQSTASSLKVDLSGTAANATAIKVDGSAVTQPVSGTVTANQGGTWTVQPGNTANTTPWLMQNVSGATGGASIYHAVSAASTNLANVKNSAGTLYGWSIFNTNAAIRYVKLHNTSGTPTAGSGVVYTIAVPPSGGSNMDVDVGINFATGIGISMVTGSADNDTTAVAAGDLIVNLHYK